LDEQVKQVREIIQRLEALIGEGAHLREDVARETVRRLSVDLRALETHLYPPGETSAPPSNPAKGNPELP
jgi:hypothetical protein